MSKLSDLLQGHDLTPTALDYDVNIGSGEWSILQGEYDKRYIAVIEPIPYKIYKTRVGFVEDGYRAGLRLSRNSVTYSPERYATIEAANEAAQNKIDELMKGK